MELPCHGILLFACALRCEPRRNISSAGIASAPAANEEGVELKRLAPHCLAKRGRRSVSKQTRQIAGWNHQTILTLKIRKNWLHG